MGEYIYTLLPAYAYMYMYVYAFIWLVIPLSLLLVAYMHTFQRNRSQ